MNPNNSDLDFIRIEKLVWIHLDSMSRIKLNRFSTNLHQTRLKTFFGLTRMSSDLFWYRLRNESELIWLVRNEFQSETSTRVNANRLKINPTQSETFIPNHDPIPMNPSPLSIRKNPKSVQFKPNFQSDKFRPRIH